MAYLSGYQGSFSPAASVVIASGQTVSAALDCGGFSLVGLVIPAAFTGTAITFQVSADGVTYQPLYDSSNTVVSITVAQGRSYALAPTNFQGAAFLKIVSGTAEGAARTIVCSLKGI